MGCTASSTYSRKTLGVWMWKAGNAPWNEDNSEWKQYSDIENHIIEEAFEQERNDVELDEYHINLRKNFQESKQNSTKQRPIKRMVMEDKSLRFRTTKRYMLENPELTAESVALGWTSPWCRFLLGADLFGVIEDDQLTDRVEKAADGVLEEAMRMGKKIETEWIAKELRNVKNKQKHEIGMCCAKIFTMDSFCHTLVNKVLRESEVQSAGIACVHNFTTEEGKFHGSALGPFCSLLWLYLHETPSKGLSCVYKNAFLSQEIIDDYEKHRDQWMVWNTFSSATKNKAKAFKDVGNTIFQIKLRPGGVPGVVDVSNLSDYPSEQEVLITAGIPYEIKSVEYSQKTNKYIISVEL